MLLTEEQLHEVYRIIRDHHNAFIINTIGPDAVAPEILEDLKEKGLVNVNISSMEEAYLYGQVLSALESAQAATMGYDEFKAYLKKNPVPLSPVERHAVQMAKMSAGQYAVGLGNRVSQKTGQLMIEADAKLRAQTRAMIREKTSANIAARESVQKLKSDLGWAKKDWARDWDRIAKTEKQTAMQTGQADQYAKKFGPDVLVAKRPMPDACKHCLRLHLAKDGNPRIYKLSELEAHGSNHGRKADAWEAVVGTTHPHCQCQLVRIPAGWGFDKDGDLRPGARGGYDDAADDDLNKSLASTMEAGKNYDFQGLAVHIENAIGSVRSWGHGEHKGETLMHAAYGELLGTKGADDDPIDVYVGPDDKAPYVYIVEQQNPHTGIYDEAKCMLGFASQEDAEAVYRVHYNRPDFLLYSTEMEIDQFKRWISGTADTETTFLPNVGAPVFSALAVNLRQAKQGLFNETIGNDLKQRSPMLVVPLKKAQITTADVAYDSMAAGRAPGPGTVTNFIVRTPVHAQAPMVEGYKDILESTGDNREAMKRDKKIYDVKEPFLRVPKPIVLPENFNGEKEQLGQGKDKENRADLDSRYLSNIPPGNSVEIKKSGPRFVIKTAQKKAK